VTPFDTWYAENVERFLPADYPKNLREVGKQQAAKIWNAALDKAITLRGAATCACKQLIESLRAPVAP
jgi:hypothetical protein